MSETTFYQRNRRVGINRAIWDDLDQNFQITKKPLNTTKITISQKISFFNILNCYKKSLKLPFYKK